NPCKKCPGPFPCSPVKWSLSLISQTKVNNIPSFNRILQQPLNITHTGPNDSDFECFYTGSPALACEDQKGTIEGYDSHGNKKCYYLCPKGKTRKDGFGCDAGCPSGQIWTGVQCVETCVRNPAVPIHSQLGIKLGGVCTVALVLNGCKATYIPLAYVPSIGMCIQVPTGLGSTDYLRAKTLLTLTVTGFDESGNAVSFKPCPSGQVWIGSQCMEYCEGVRERAKTSGYDSPSLMPGIKLNNKCHFPCYQRGSSNSCVFVPKLSLWLQKTKTMNNERLNHPRHILNRLWTMDYNDYLLFF
ncbi:MAG: hypothetical protein OXJ52_01210, partial [Oligoflexia bacterium]|nr:hypothetical protein [Oligoflexia bacterium]